MSTYDNGCIETPDWTPSPRPNPFDVFWADHMRDMEDPEYRAAWLDAEHLVRGEN